MSKPNKSSKPNPLQTMEKLVAAATSAAHTASIWKTLLTANDDLKSAIEELDRQCKSEIDALNSKEEELLSRQTALEENKRRCAEENGDVNAEETDLVEFNVGGRVFVVMRQNLTKFEGTMMEALFSGRWDKRLVRDDRDRVFLDLNPDCFGAIVNYLGAVEKDKGSTDAPSVDEEYQDSLTHQLNLFGLLDELLPLDSKIVRSLKHADLLQGWLEEDKSSGDFVLLYRSSRDGRDDATFHSQCDNKGPTLTIVKTTEGHVIGGYSDVPWNGSVTGNGQSNKAFLYAFSKTDAFEPVKMKLKGTTNQNAIYNNPSYGPTFGGGNAQDSGHDLYVDVKGEKLNLKIGQHTYTSPPNELANADTSYRTFTIQEMEVFQIIPTQAKPKKLKSYNNLSSKDVQHFTSAINTAFNRKWEALPKIETEIAALEASFAAEEGFIKLFSNQQVVSLNVSGTRVTTTRQTLQLYQDSTLDAKICEDRVKNRMTIVPNKSVKDWDKKDLANWLHKIDSLPKSTVDGIEEKNFDLSGQQLLEIVKEVKNLVGARGKKEVLVEHSSYCLGKIIDHLRLEKMFGEGRIEYKPKAPVVQEVERKEFEKLVGVYFYGDGSKSLLG